VERVAEELGSGDQVPYERGHVPPGTARRPAPLRVRHPLEPGPEPGPVRLPRHRRGTGLAIQA
jgi:hypothetical protein